MHKSRLPVQGGVEMDVDVAKFVPRGPSTRLSTNNIGNILLLYRFMFGNFGRSEICHQNCF